MKRLALLFGMLVFILPISVQAHPGRTDSSGCHTCRTNCSKWGLSTGEYHCHGDSSTPAPVKQATPAPAPKPAVAPAPKPDPNAVLKSLVLNEKTPYQANHPGFREKLIERLMSENDYDASKFSWVADMVYKNLPDIK